MKKPHAKDLPCFAVGEVIADRFEIKKHLGYGGMGLVVQALDLALESETVVLKILYPELATDKIHLARFQREVILTRKLSHPSIVRIYDLGEIKGQTSFISMEYIAGEHLQAKLERGNRTGLPFNDIVHYLTQITEGLVYAHSKKIIHRDLKPANIMIDEDSNVKITDFGVAKSSFSQEQLTQTDEAVGSMIYMSPEQIGNEDIDQRVDIYNLGMMAYEIAVGNPPFPVSDWLMLIHMQLTRPVPNFASEEKGIPEWFEKVVHQATQKEPKDRFQTAKELLEAIQSESKSHAKGRRIWSQKPAYDSKNAVGLSIFAVLAVFSLIGIIGVGGFFLFEYLGRFL